MYHVILINYWNCVHLLKVVSMSAYDVYSTYDYSGLVRGDYNRRDAYHGQCLQYVFQMPLTECLVRGLVTWTSG